MGRSAIVAALVLVFAGGCRRADTSAKPTPIATVGEQVISSVDFKARAAEQTFDRGRYKSLERKKELLEGMIRSELLVEEARRRHLDEAPEVRSAIERVLVQKLTRVVADEADKKNPLPEADTRRYYDQHKSEFTTPTRVRVSHLFLAAPEKDPKRAAAAAEASRLLAQVQSKAAKGVKQALELAASQRSDDAATKATGGNLGFRTRDELVAAWGSAFADAALALKSPQEIGPVVATPKGVHLIKLLGRQDGYETSFESAKSRIAGRLGAERRARSIDDLAADLRKKTTVKIDQQALARIDLATPAEPNMAAGHSGP